jgi:hypothetical protein
MTTKLPPKLLAAQQRAAEERGDPLPIDRLDRVAIASSIDTIELRTRLDSLKARYAQASENLKARYTQALEDVAQATTKKLELTDEERLIVLALAKQEGFIPKPKPKPTYQIKGTITIDHTTNLWGNDRIFLFDFLNRIVGEHTENGVKCWSNQRLSGDVVFGWDKIVDKDKFIAYAEDVARQVDERYPDSKMFVTAAIELLL